MLMKYSDLMEELQKIVPNYDKSILNDNKFDEALTLGTKTN
jgi:6-pyruvoyl-tetrahydropterin synthase